MTPKSRTDFWRCISGRGAFFVAPARKGDRTAGAVVWEEQEGKAPARTKKGLRRSAGLGFKRMDVQGRVLPAAR